MTDSMICTDVAEAARDVKTFVLEPIEPKAPGEPPAFKRHPGQYLTLTVQIGGQQVNRCYTIASAATEQRPVSITVKREPGGLVSNWLHDHLSVGDAVQVSGPFGRFSMAEHPAAKYLFLSGGSGITPMMAMTRTLHDVGEPADVVFVHNARSPEDIIFRQELVAIDATNPSIRVITICEQDSPTERWNGIRGRLTLPVLRQSVHDLLDREIFTCGPPAYMAAVRELLATAGVSPDRAHEESFCFEDLPSLDQTSTGTATEATGRVFSIRFDRSNRTIECGEQDSILSAALAAGVTVPWSCGQGVCGTCKSALLTGDVDMHNEGGIHPREIAQGKILLCCSRPLTDLVVDA